MILMELAIGANYHAMIAILNFSVPAAMMHFYLIQPALHNVLQAIMLMFQYCNA